MPQINDDGFYKEKCYICGEWKQAFQRIGKKATYPEEVTRGANTANEREISGLFPTIEYFCDNPNCQARINTQLIRKEWKQVDNQPDE